MSSAAASEARPASLTVSAGRASPSDIVAALRGSSTVVLRGFSQQVKPPVFLRPGVQFVSPSIATDELHGVLAARSARMRLLLWLALACTHLAVGFAAAQLWREPSAPAAPRSPVVASWSAVAVEPGAVVVQVGQGEGASRISVPVGGKFPNGDVLTMVDADRAAYAIGATRVFLPQVSRGSKP